MKIIQELQRKYVFTLEYRKGANHGVPEARTRNLVNDPEKNKHREIKLVTSQQLLNKVVSRI